MENQEANQETPTIKIVSFLTKIDFLKSIITAIICTYVCVEGLTNAVLETYSSRTIFMIRLYLSLSIFLNIGLLVGEIKAFFFVNSLLRKTQVRYEELNKWIYFRYVVLLVLATLIILQAISTSATYRYNVIAWLVLIAFYHLIELYYARGYYYELKSESTNLNNDDNDERIY